MNSISKLNKISLRSDVIADQKNKRNLKASWLDTKLGLMFTIADDVGLYLLEFACGPHLERKVERLKIKMNAAIILGMTNPISSITLELKSYFDGELKQFKTAIHLLGTAFQRFVWEELARTEYGQTRSYVAQAKAIGKATAYRAVANANGANQLAIIVPCHRIINKNGGLGGYSCGVALKQWLIDHENRYA